MSPRVLRNLSVQLGGLLILLGFGMSSAHATVTASWTSPADGSTFAVPGAPVAPTGVASATGTTGTGLDLALVLDSSGSMRILETSGGVTQSRQQWQKDAAITLVNNLPEASTSVSVIEFDSDANTVQVLASLATNKTDIINAINSVDASGSTRIGGGMLEAQQELTGPRADPTRSQQMVVFSDGASTDTPSVRADLAVAAGVERVHSILLPGGDQSTMEDIADGVDDVLGTADDNGTFFNAADDLQGLIDIFQGTGGNLVGIDRVEIELPDGTTTTVSVDAFGNFTSPDFSLELGDNVFTATAFDDQGNASAPVELTLVGVGATAVPEPGVLGLIGLGLVGVFGVGRRRQQRL